MIFWKIFLAFFIPGIVGYGGGPAMIPLVKEQVVDRYHWMDINAFSSVLALGNSLPGPIATKMAGYIGYAQGGVLGSIIGVLAVIAPSLIVLIILMRLLYKYKDSPKIKQLTLLIRPTVAVLLGLMVYDFFYKSVGNTGWTQTVILAIISFILMERVKLHPAFVIIGALGYGAIFLGQ